MTKILVAGGGVAGSAAAIAIAQAGRAVTLIEREAAPTNKVCGEFLSAEAQSYLTQLGLDVPALGGHRITHLRLIRGTHAITSKLPFEGVGLTRKTLDEALLTHAARMGVLVQRGRAIRQISFDSGIHVALDQSAPLRPETLFLATGKHDARGAARSGTSSRLVGFKTYFSLNPAQCLALSGHVELILFAGGYAGLQMVEHGQANFCVLVESALLQRIGSKFSALLDHLQSVSPHLATRLAGSQELLAAPLSIARVPYGFIHRPQATDPAQLFRLGDQAAVIQSFTGDGMAIALHSAALAARFLRRGEACAAYHRRLAADVSGQIRNAGTLHTALCVPLLGPALFTAARIFPQALAVCAALTRVPARARL